MSDQFRQTFPIALTFSDGELPSSDKMQSLASQSRNGQTLIQFALGDLWNQSGDSLLGSNTDITQNALMIPNLARYIGATKLTNPRIPALSSITEYTYAFTSDAGNNEAFLTFPPHASPGYSWGGTASGVVDATPKASKSLVVATGNWYIDTNTGLCYFYDTIGAGWTLTYRPTIDGDVGANQTYNVIPDPDTDTGYAFLGLKIAYKNGTDNSEGYYVWLPPRGPLDARATSRAPQASSSDNFSSTPDSLPVLFWQDDNVAATTGTYAEHYRYTLPYILTGADGWGQGAALPRGLLYLWDHSGTGTVIEGIAFFADDIASPTAYKFIVRGANLDTYLASGDGSSAYPASRLTDTSTHTADHYPSNGLRLITVGTDISTFASQLMASYLQHDHGSSSSLPSKPVQHAKLENLFGDDGSTPRLDGSKLDYDDHPQYLHRGGFGTATTRDKFQNAMLGDLLISSSNATSNYVNISSDSNKILFGGSTSTARGAIFFDAGTNKLVLSGRNNAAGTAGVVLGDPDVDSDDALLIECYNQDFGIYPMTNPLSSAMTIDCGTLYLGALAARTNDIYIGANDANVNSTIRGYNVNILSGTSPPSVLGNAQNDIELRAHDKIYIQAGDDIVLKHDSAQTDTLILPLIPTGGDLGSASENLYKLESSAQPYWVIGTGDTVSFLIPPFWPDRMTVSQLDLKCFKFTNSGDIVGSFYKTSWSGDTDSGDFTNLGNITESITGTTSPHAYTTCSFSSLSNNTGLRKSNNALWIRVTNNTGASNAGIYLACQLTVSFDNSNPWPSQTVA